MTYETFKTKLLEALNAQSGEEVEKQVERIQKNNGVHKECLILKRKGSRVVPAIHLEDLYEQADAQPVDYRELAEQLLQICRTETTWVEKQLSTFADFYQARDNIYARVINADRNKEMLEDVPHEKILDLAVVCYYEMHTERGNSTVQIDRRIIERWGITEEQLLAVAKANTARKQPVSLMKLTDMLRLLAAERHMAYMSEFDDADDPLYILTNMEKCFGAYVLFYPNVQRHVADVLGSSFYVLPSSIHETILLPVTEPYTPYELQDMVKTVNRELVDPKEVLSNSVYLYDRRTHMMSIAAKE